MEKSKLKQIKDYNKTTYKWEFKDLGSLKIILYGGSIIEYMEFSDKKYYFAYGVHSISLNYLKAVHQALGELFEILEKNKNIRER